VENSLLEGKKGKKARLLLDPTIVDLRMFGESMEKLGMNSSFR